MTWVSFAFPRCPSCGREWATCRHRECYTDGELKVDLDRKIVRCGGCSKSWDLFQTQFYCNCTYIFSATDVRDVLNETLRAAHLLARMIEENQKVLAEIKSQSNSSFRSWLDGFARGLGGTLGMIAGRIIGTLFGNFF